MRAKLAAVALAALVSLTWLGAGLAQGPPQADDLGARMLQERQQQKRQRAEARLRDLRQLKQQMDANPEMAEQLFQQFLQNQKSYRSVKNPLP